MKELWTKIKAKFFTKEFLTFGIIGGVNTLVSLGLYMGFVSLGIEPGIASIVGDLLSIMVSYFLNMKLTYHKPYSLKSFVTFPFSYIPGTLISALMVLLIVNVLHGPRLWAKALSLPITIPLNYVVQSLLVKWSSKPDENKKVGE